MNWMNLDLKAAETASALAKEGEKLGLKKNEAEKINQQAASVLAHQGLSAFFLHLKAEGPRPHKKNKKGEEIREPSKQKQQFSELLAQHGYDLLGTAWPRNILPAIVWENAKSMEHHIILAKSADRLEAVGKFGEDLPRLIEAKQLLGQTLIYLRYHTKTFPGGKD